MRGNLYVSQSFCNAYPVHYEMKDQEEYIIKRRAGVSAEASLSINKSHISNRQFNGEKRVSQASLFEVKNWVT